MPEPSLDSVEENEVRGLIFMNSSGVATRPNDYEIYLSEKDINNLVVALDKHYASKFIELIDAVKINHDYELDDARATLAVRNSLEASWAQIKPQLKAKIKELWNV